MVVSVAGSLQCLVWTLAARLLTSVVGKGRWAPGWLSGIPTTLYAAQPARARIAGVRSHASSRRLCQHLGMTDADLKQALTTYLQAGRDVLLWKLEGLSEYDVRRPLTPTGTNLLGLVKHLAGVEAGYFGSVMGRPFPEPMPWMDDDAEPNADMWATPDEARTEVVEQYRRVWAHADETIAALSLDSRGEVPWWPDERRHPTLHTLLVHVIAETHRHAGHADIVRETIDGSAGFRSTNSNLPGEEADWWRGYRDRLEETARAVGGPADRGQG